MSTTLSSPSCCTKWASHCLAGSERNCSTVGSLSWGVGTHPSDSNTPTFEGTHLLVHPVSRRPHGWSSLLQRPCGTSVQGTELLKGKIWRCRENALGCTCGSVPFWRTVRCPRHNLGVHPPQQTDTGSRWEASERHSTTSLMC